MHDDKVATSLSDHPQSAADFTCELPHEDLVLPGRDPNELPGCDPRVLLRVLLRTLRRLRVLEGREIDVEAYASGESAVLTLRPGASDGRRRDRLIFIICSLHRTRCTRRRDFEDEAVHKSTYATRYPNILVLCVPGRVLFAFF